MPNIGVIGGGTMGTGIAYVCAQAGGEVLVVEPDKVRAEQMRASQHAAAQSAVSRGKMTADDAATIGERITVVSAVSGLPSGLDLVVESVFEDMALKRGILADAAARGTSVQA